MFTVSVLANVAYTTYKLITTLYFIPAFAAVHHGVAFPVT